MKNWKSPGADQIQNYWLKSFTKAHVALAAAMQRIIKGEDEIPEFLTEGITHLTHKTINQSPACSLHLNC